MTRKSFIKVRRSSRNHIRIKQTVMAVLVSSCYSSFAFAVIGAGYFVNTTNDAVDLVPGDGLCNTGRTPPSGYTYECTLRAAIQESNANSPNSISDPDIITLPAGSYLLTIAGSNEDNAATGDLDIKDALVINGSGSGSTILNANGIDRALHVLSGPGVTLNNFTVRNGTAPNMLYPEGHGGGIHNLGRLTLNNMNIENNYAVFEGGGVYNTGILTVANSRIANNSGAGGLSNQASGQMTVINSVIAANSSGSGSVAGMGGGVHSFGIALTLRNSLVAGNFALRDGGGIYFGGSATPLIENVTISGNRANRFGGGMHARNKATIRSTTIANNYARQDGGGLYVFNSSSGSRAVVTLHNSILATNLKGWSIANDCSVPASESGSGTNYAQLTSLGYNIDLDNNCRLITTGDRPATNPTLAALANNGGPTDTHALLLGSPAIDNGAISCPATDQRNVIRPQDGDGNGIASCDIGAFERN